MKITKQTALLLAGLSLFYCLGVRAQNKESLQNIEKKSAILEKQAVQLGWPADKTAQVQECIRGYHLALESAARDQAVRDSTQIISVNDRSLSTTEIQKEFIAELKGILTREDFESLFADQFKAVAGRNLEARIQQLRRGYTLNADEVEALRKKLYPKCYDLAFTETYHQPDGEYLYKARKEAEYQLEEVTFNAFESFEKLYAGSPYQKHKLDEIRSRARKIGIDEGRIEKLCHAIARRDLNFKKAGIAWERDHQKFVLGFWDKSSSRQGYKKAFREQLVHLFSIREFEQLFGNHIEHRAWSKSKDKIDNLAGLYSLDTTQKAEVLELLQDFHREETLAEQYYFYSPLKKQKVHAATYAFQSKLRTQLESYGKLEPETADAGKPEKLKTFDWEKK